MTTAAPAKRDPYTVGCGGDGCNSRDPWPLHHVRHRGVFCRLCTSCVLRYHPGAFCSSCFDVLDSPPPPDHPLVYCSNCPAISHLSCLPDPQAASQYLCPCCANPHGFSYFPIGTSREASASDGEERPADGQRRTLDLSSAKVLLAAAQLAAASMSRAVVASRADAERKAKEAAMARKRAREMLERALSLSKKEREKVKESAKMAVVPAAEVAESKKKTPRMGAAVTVAMSAQKKVQDRQRDKSMKFVEPTQMVYRPPVQGIAGNDANKVPSINSVQNHVTADMRDRVGSLSQLPKLVKQEEREKEVKLLSNSQSPGVKEGEKGLKVDADKDSRIPQSTQAIAEASVSRTNNRAIFTGSPSTASLHS